MASEKKQKKQKGSLFGFGKMTKEETAAELLTMIAEARKV